MTLELNSISFAYDSALNDILSNLTIQFENGTRVALIGPSGCGKSTLLKIIAGVLKPNKGQVLLEENSVLDREIKGMISYVPQETSLLPWRTSLENVKLPEALGIRQQRLPTEMLERVGLKDAAHMYPRELSGGMRARVGLARALSVDPQLLLLDEPFSSLDELTRFEVLLLIESLIQKTNVISILVTHSLMEAMFFADKVFVMTEGGALLTPIEINIPRPRPNPFRSGETYAKLLFKLHSLLTGETVNAPHQ